MAGEISDANDAESLSYFCLALSCNLLCANDCRFDALHYYFAMGDWMRLPFGPFNLVAVHYFYLPTSWISWVLFWLPSTLLVCAAILNINTLVRVKWLMPIAAICIFFGLLSLPVPYAIGVYPNIRRDIGGGSPMLAIIGTNTHGDILKDLHQRSNGLGREDLEKELERGALLVWHFGDAVVCSSISKIFMLFISFP